MSGSSLKRATPHPMSVERMPAAHRRKVTGALVDNVNYSSVPVESTEPFAPEACPGYRILDRYADQFKWLAKPRFSRSKDPEAAWKLILDASLESLEDDPDAAYAGVDGSCPPGWQAATGVVIKQQGAQVYSGCHAAGRASSTDAELFAIRVAISNAVGFGDVKHITIFTDAMHAARLSVDPSPHSFQSQSLMVCRILEPWFRRSPDHKVTFIESPSDMEWGIQNEAHDLIAGMRGVAVVPTTKLSLQYVCDFVDKSARAD
ncbi:hypothetical protein BDZ97DRAFT_1814787, partial [Flammula alnicola]